MKIKLHRAAALTTGFALAASLMPLTSSASSHREAPAITRAPAVDSTDFYLFNSYEPGRDGYVTLLADYLPLQDPYGGPNYFALDPSALYEIHVDNDGDAKEDLTFQFRFTNKLANSNQGIKLGIGGSQVAVPLKNVGPISANDSSALNFNESYTLTLVRGDPPQGSDRIRWSIRPMAPPSSASRTTTSARRPSATRRRIRPTRTSFSTRVTIPGCSQPGRVFVGQRKEPFAVNLGRIFDLVNIVPVDGSAFPGGIMQDPANNQIADKNITTLALEVHSSCLKGCGQRRDRRVDQREPASGAHPQSASHVLEAGSERRRVDAGVAPLGAARERSGDRHPRQGSLQREPAEG